MAADKPTFTATPCVRVIVTDERRAPSGIVVRLLDWHEQEQVFPLRGTSGGTAWLHFADYSPADAERVIAWLRENGASEVRDAR